MYRFVARWRFAAHRTFGRSRLFTRVAVARESEQDHTAHRLASRLQLTLRSIAVILADGTLRETSIMTVVVVRVVVAIAP